MSDPATTIREALERESDDPAAFVALAELVEERDRLADTLHNIEMLARADGQTVIPGLARAALDRQQP